MPPLLNTPGRTIGVIGAIGMAAERIGVFAEIFDAGCEEISATLASVLLEECSCPDPSAAQSKSSAGAIVDWKTVTQFRLIVH